MSFATVENVKAYFRNFATTTQAAVTDAKIQTWLDSAHLMVMGKLHTLYSPINQTDHPSSCLIIVDMEAMKVAGIVDDILNSYSEASLKPRWDLKAEKLLNEYVPPKDSKTGKQNEPDIKLPDAVYVGTNEQTTKPRISTTGTAIFIKGQDNW